MLPLIAFTKVMINCETERWDEVSIEWIPVDGSRRRGRPKKRGWVDLDVFGLEWPSGRGPRCVERNGEYLCPAVKQNRIMKRLFYY